MSGGELLGAANQTLNNTLTVSGTSTLAAEHGTTLNETGNYDDRSEFDAELRFARTGRRYHLEPEPF